MPLWYTLGKSNLFIFFSTYNLNELIVFNSPTSKLEIFKLKLVVLQIQSAKSFHYCRKNKFYPDNI